MGKYVVSSDEYYYIHKVVLLCNEFYDDLISRRQTLWFPSRRNQST